jgi:hypothetical protein
MAHGIYCFGVMYAFWVVPLAPVHIADGVEAPFKAAIVLDINYRRATMRPFARLVTG